jgi:hypothetical protein
MKAFVQQSILSARRAADFVTQPRTFFSHLHALIEVAVSHAREKSILVEAAPSMAEVAVCLEDESVEGCTIRLLGVAWNRVSERLAVGIAS